MILDETINSPMPLRTMYFGGAVVPPSRVNPLDKIPTSSFDGCFDFASDSSFDEIDPDQKSINQARVAIVKASFEQICPKIVPKVNFRTLVVILQSIRNKRMFTWGVP